MRSRSRLAALERIPIRRYRDAR